MRICGYVIAFATLAASPAHADIIGIGFSQTLNGSGNVFVLCATCPGGMGTASVTTTRFTGDSYTGMATFTDPGTSRSATVIDQVNHTNELTSTGFGVDVAEDITFKGLGGQWSATGTDSDSFSVNFTVTTLSLLDLSGMGNGTFQSVQLKDSDGSTLFQTINGRFETFVTLEPGTYQILGRDVFSAGTGPRDVVTFFTLASDFEINASFSAVVPEPEGGAAIIFALIAATAFLEHRRRLGSHLWRSRPCSSRRTSA